MESHGPSFGRVSSGMDKMVKIFVRYFGVQFSLVPVGKRAQGSDGCLLFRFTDLTRAAFISRGNLSELIPFGGHKLFAGVLLMHC